MLRTYGNLAAFLRNMLGWRLGDPPAGAPSVSRRTSKLLLDAIVSDYLNTSGTSNLTTALSVGSPPLALSMEQCGPLLSSGHLDSGGRFHSSASGRFHSSNSGRRTGCLLSNPSTAMMDNSVWIEPQCAAFITINENLPNLLPCVPILLGAGGIATDFSGKPLQVRAPKAMDYFNHFFPFCLDIFEGI